MSAQSEAISTVVGDQVTIGKRILKPAVVVPVSLVIGLALGALVAILMMGMPAVGALEGPGAHAVIPGNPLTRSEASFLAENPELSVVRRSVDGQVRAQTSESIYLAANPELSWSRRRADPVPRIGGCSAYLAENPELSLTRRSSQGGATGFCP